jgi:hypothetical protein
MNSKDFKKAKSCLEGVIKILKDLNYPKYSFLIKNTIDEKCPWYIGKCTINTEIPIVDKNKCNSSEGFWISCPRAFGDLYRAEGQELVRAAGYFKDK